MKRLIGALVLSLFASQAHAAEPATLFPWLQLFQLGGAATSYREDAPHVSGHYGNLVLGVRNDAGGTLCGTTGDYCVFQLDSTGQLRVVAPLPSGASTDRTTAAGPFSFRLSDGAAFYDAAKTGQLPAALDGSGFLKTHEQGTATVTGSVTANIGTSGSLALDASVTGLQVAQGSTTSGQKGGLAQGAVTTGAPTYTTAQTSPLSLTTAGALRTDASGTTQPVSGTLTANQGTANATPWNENLAQVAGAAASTAASGVLKVGIVGNAAGALDAANNATAPANELVIGGELQSGAQAAAATAGQAGRFVGGLDHVQYARLGGPVYWHCGLTAIAATLTQCKAAPAAGLKSYVTDISVVSDTATAGQFTLRYGTGSNCGTGTTTLFPDVAATTTGKLPYPANTASQPVNYSFLTPLQPAAANAVCAICVATNTCTISMQGYDGS